MSSSEDITINGQPSSLGGVASRTMLADFLRDRLDLTGTHLGCEHGICGACTVSIDGQAARSCITLAHACAGAQVTTIEGFDRDALMEQLRQAFTQEHALQCGFCTPGMLIAARDLVLRHPDADEAKVRLEMSGNLCRCTGYMGIVNAVLRVLKQRREAGVAAAVSSDVRLGPVGAHAAPTVTGVGSLSSSPITATEGSRPKASRSPESAGSVRRPTGPLTNLEQSFTVDFPVAQVWAFFSQLEVVGRCLPGLTLEQSPVSGQFKISLRVRAGPIGAEFDGVAKVIQDVVTHTGRIIGDARDSRSGTNAHGDIRYRLTSINDGRATKVEIDLGYVLAGPLAQFSRGAIAKDIARKLTEAFAENLRHRLLGGPEAAISPRGQVKALNAGGLVWSVITTRLRGLFAWLFGRRS